MEKIHQFECRKCGHILFLEKSNFKKLEKYCCPECGEEPPIWIFNKLLTEKQVDNYFK